MSDSMNIVVEINDRDAGTMLGRSAAGRTVRVEVTLPTGEGSEGPGLDHDGWSDDVLAVVRVCSSAAYACLDEAVEPAVADELRDLDARVDAAHQRLDATRAPDMEEIRRRAAQDAELARRSEELALERELLEGRKRAGQDRPDA